MEGDCRGMRVGEITKGTHLSQPAVSHHLKILCDAKILTVRKEGTMNFYQMNPNKEEITNLYLLFGKILEAINKLEAERNKK
ncbi:MAG: helix-turn-helix transcriptional regulator [Clostridia bacterium]|nr:helix-turn-helix transcriptional regulator [Clostridia bacterium]